MSDPDPYFANDCEGTALAVGDVVRRAKGGVLGQITYVFQGAAGVVWANVKDPSKCYGRPISGRQLRFVRKPLQRRHQ